MMDQGRILSMAHSRQIRWEEDEQVTPGSNGNRSLEKHSIKSLIINKILPLTNGKRKEIDKVCLSLITRRPRGLRLHFSRAGEKPPFLISPGADWRDFPDVSTLY